MDCNLLVIINRYTYLTELSKNILPQTEKKKGEKSPVALAIRTHDLLITWWCSTSSNFDFYCANFRICLEVWLMDGCLQHQIVSRDSFILKFVSRQEKKFFMWRKSNLKFSVQLSQNVNHSIFVVGVASFRQNVLSLNVTLSTVVIAQLPLYTDSHFIENIFC